MADLRTDCNPQWRSPSRLKQWLFTATFLLASILITACGVPQVSAENRLFLPLSLDFLDIYSLETSSFENTTVGGLSAITYDRQRDRFYALSDDRSHFAPARFYTLQLSVTTDDPTQPRIDQVAIAAVTPLLTEEGQPYADGTVDPEGVSLSPRQTVLIASEGDADAGIPPFIDEFDLATGQFQNHLPIPQRFIPEIIEGDRKGVQNNRGFEALTVNTGGYSPAGWTEPFRVFAATESSLEQDIPQDIPQANSETDDTEAMSQTRTRFLHYLVGGEASQDTLIAEHLYLLDEAPFGSFSNGLTELLVMDSAGHFLSLERSFGLTGFGAKIFQLAIADATDTSGIPALPDTLSGLQPIRKQLLLDLKDLDIPLDNLEGMTLGPRLPDGTTSLILISDNNFSDEQTTQLLLFRINGV